MLAALLNSGGSGKRCSAPFYGPTFHSPLKEAEGEDFHTCRVHLWELHYQSLPGTEKEGGLIQSVSGYRVLLNYFDCRKIDATFPAHMTQNLLSDGKQIAGINILHGCTQHITLNKP